MRHFRYVIHCVIARETAPMASRIRVERVARFGVAEYSETMIDTVENESVTATFVFRDWQTNDAVSPFIVPRKMFQDALKEKALETIIP